LSGDGNRIGMFLPKYAVAPAAGGADGGNTFVVVPVLQGSVYNSLTTQTKEIKIPRGDTRTLTFVVDGDWSTWECWFGAKVQPGDAAYTIEPVQCPAPVYDAIKDLTTGYIELSAADTATAGKQWGEFELRDGSARVTPIQFKLTIVQDVINS
jgi:hypothetical protein